jgi:hypothetical protein
VVAFFLSDSDTERPNGFSLPIGYKIFNSNTRLNDLERDKLEEKSKWVATIVFKNFFLGKKIVFINFLPQNGNFLNFKE